MFGCLFKFASSLSDCGSGCFEFWEGYEDESDYDDSEEEQEDMEDYKKGGYHPVKIADIYHDKYVVIRKLGWGHFSTVWLARDRINKRYTAVKAVKSASQYTETAVDEIKLLKKVRECDPSHPGREHIVQMVDDFKLVGLHGTHVCMVFEVLGDNLLKLIIKSNYRGMAISLVKRIAKQVLQGLDYLHSECKIIHTDIKPENILLTVKDTDVRLWASQDVSEDPKFRANLPRHLREKKADPIRLENMQKEASKGTVKLTKNQKKKLKKKLKKAEAKGDVNDNEEPQNLQKRTESINSEMSIEENKETTEKENVSDNITEPSSTLHNTDSGTHTLNNGDCDTENEEKAEEIVEEIVENGVTEEIIEEVKENSNSDSGVFISSEENGEEKEVGEADNKLQNEVIEDTDNADKADTVLEMNNLNDAKTDTKDPLIEMNVKIADLGNACWVNHHYSDDIQTRQYRSLEVLLGIGYNTAADMWSTACMIFELATGEYLFDPHSGSNYCRDEDHLAHIIELLGPVPKHICMMGKYSKEFFNKKNELRHIRDLRPWALSDVLREKYEWNKEDATLFAEFLTPMLDLNHDKRISAKGALAAPWLEGV